MSFPVIGTGFENTLTTTSGSTGTSNDGGDGESNFLGTLQNQLGTNSTNKTTTSQLAATTNASIASNSLNLPVIARTRTAAQIQSDASFVNAFQTSISSFDSRIDRTLIGDTTKLVPLDQEHAANEIPPIDQYESTRIFAVFVFEEQARIAREIDQNNGKFKLRGEEYDINKTSGTMQLNFFLTEAQTALGAMQRMLSSYRDWEKRAVEFLG